MVDRDASVDRILQFAPDLLVRAGDDRPPLLWSGVERGRAEQIGVEWSKMESDHRSVTSAA